MLYYAHGVGMALSPNEGLKHQDNVRGTGETHGRNGAKLE